MGIKSRYTGGNSGWGTLVYECVDCGEIVAEFECDEFGIPVRKVFDIEDTHTCPKIENEPCDEFFELTLFEKLRKVFKPEPKPLDISDEGIVI